MLQGFGVLLSGAGVPPMVRRSRLRAFLPVESTILEGTGTGAAGTLTDMLPAAGAG